MVPALDIIELQLGQILGARGQQFLVTGLDRTRVVDEVDNVIRSVCEERRIAEVGDIPDDVELFLYDRPELAERPQRQAQLVKGRVLREDEAEERVEVRKTTRVDPLVTGRPATRSR